MVPYLVSNLKLKRAEKKTTLNVYSILKYSLKNSSKNINAKCDKISQYLQTKTVCQGQGIYPQIEKTVNSRQIYQEPATLLGWSK